MMLNSMWGKLGQRTDKTQVQEFDDPRKFTEFLESDKYEVSVLYEEVVEIHYKHKVEDNPILLSVSCSLPHCMVKHRQCSPFTEISRPTYSREHFYISFTSVLPPMA